MFSVELYAQIVYLTLITSIDGDYTKSSPDYLREKSIILGMDERDAWGFGYLDIHNMRRACDYCHLWHLTVPEKWRKELDLQTLAEEEWKQELNAHYLQE